MNNTRRQGGCLPNKREGNAEFQINRTRESLQLSQPLLKENSSGVEREHQLQEMVIAEKKGKKRMQLRH